MRPSQRFFFHSVIFLFTLFFLGPPLLAQKTSPDDLLVLNDVTVVDVRTGALQPNQTVVLNKNHIETVGPSKSVKYPRNAPSLNCRGLFLIPGLWDMHVHLVFGDWFPGAQEISLPLFVANGVTGVRDMGSELEIVQNWRDEIEAGRLVGPRIFTSGPMLDGPKPRFPDSIAVTTPEDGARAVDDLKRRGVDFIKLQSLIPRDAVFAIAAEAKKQEIPFEGHVPDSVRASEMSAAGMHSFEHLIGIFEASSPDETKYLTGKKTVGMFLATYDPGLEAGIIQLLAKNQVWQCPTLYWERGQWLVDAIDYNKDPDLAYAAHTWVIKHWPAAQKSILETLDTDRLPIREAFVAHELDIVRKLHAADVPFLAGTDTPAGVDVIPGVSLHLELQRFVAAGFTPLQALQTATLNPAKFLDKLDDFGTVQPGRIADLVLLEANPLEDIANTRKIAAVITDGRYLSQQDLTQLQVKLKQLAATR